MSRKETKKHPSTFWFEGDIIDITAENEFFRRAIFTGEHSQLILMSIPGHGELREEKQEAVDKILFIVRGRAKSILNGRAREAGKHDVVFVPAGNLHKLTNAGAKALKLFVVYSPALYPDGTSCKTQEDAMAAAQKEMGHLWEQ